MAMPVVDLDADDDDRVEDDDEKDKEKVEDWVKIKPYSDFKHNFIRSTRRDILIFQKNKAITCRRHRGRRGGRRGPDPGQFDAFSLALNIHLLKHGELGIATGKQQVDFAIAGHR